MHKLKLLLYAATMLVGACATSPRLVRVPNTPNLRINLQYKTTHNITGKPIYARWQKALLAPEANRALVAAAASLETQGYGIEVLDAWRPWEATRLLWNKAVEIGMTSYYAPPQLGSAHNSGEAVDIALFYLCRPEQPVLMKQDFDNPKDNQNPEGDAHSAILKKAMVRAGFTPNKRECWHFSYPSKTTAGEIPFPPRDPRQQPRCHSSNLALLSNNKKFHPAGGWPQAKRARRRGDPAKFPPAGG